MKRRRLDEQLMCFSSGREVKWNEDLDLAAWEWLVNLGWSDKAEIHLEPAEDRTMGGGKEIAYLTML